MEQQKNTRFENHLIDNRQVRIFLSSTFSDMQKERDALIQTFEMLKVEAAKRNVSLSVVDLRWGVTEEEAKSGKVISVCLNEIENSHPFFIGILGSNYGTALELSELEKNPELKERYDWIEKAISDGMSITEMEIQYGVLSNNDEIDAAFFFKKSIQPDNNKRLTTLKEEIRKKYDPNYQNDYTTPSELCEKVTTEVRKILDKHFPEKEVVTPLDKERTAQRSYINSRHSYYFERQSYYDIIDSFVHSEEQHLVFTGESGIGKSALLANWIKKNENNADFNLVYHFVGNSFSGNSYESILRHLCDEMYVLYSIEKDDEQSKKIEEEAQRLVAEICFKGKSLVIVIDGINQIITQGEGREKLLLWLPLANKNVKYIFSTLPDDETMKTFQRHGFRIETVEPLTETERLIWIPQYLGRVGKHLDEKKFQLMRIVNDEECKNTLVLRTLLDELTCFGIYEEIDNRINYYLSATSIPDFFDKVLQRMEVDYSSKSDLVRHALTLIAISEQGLSEDEILNIIGIRRQPLEWHLFFCAFYNHLVVKNGLVSFSHHYMRDAVSRRYYTANNCEMVSYRHEITDYFLKIANTNRRLSELTYQYFMLCEKDNLYHMLANVVTFDYFDSANRLLLGLYWRSLLYGNKEKYSLSVFLDINTETEEMIPKYNNISLFIHDFIGDIPLAIKYLEKALTMSEQLLIHEHPLTVKVIRNLGVLYTQCGNYSKAMLYNVKALEVTKKYLGENHPTIATSYNNIGAVCGFIGDYEKALDSYCKALTIIEKVFGVEHINATITMNNIGAIYDELGNYSKAKEYYFKALSIQEKMLGRLDPHTATSYQNIGLLYYHMGDYVAALDYLNESLSIEKEVLGEEHPQTASTYNNIGTVYDEKREYSQALDYYFKALPVFSIVFGTEHPQTASLLGNIGLVYNSIGDSDKALEYQKKALAIREKTLGIMHSETAISYGNIAGIYDDLGDFDHALEFYFKSLAIQKQIFGDNHPCMAESYNNIGLVYNNQGQYLKAMEYNKKALAITENTLGKNHLKTAVSYNNIGLSYCYLGEYEKAIEFFSDALSILKSVSDNANYEIATTYNNIASAYDGLCNYSKALDYYFKSLSICKAQEEENPTLATAYNNIGLAYINQGNWGKALEYLNKALEVHIDVFGSSHPYTQDVKDTIERISFKMDE